MEQSHMTDDEARCELCGELMPPNESMFKFHGYSGDCPKPPLPMPPSELDQLRAEVAALRKVTVNVTAHLVAAHSLLKRGGKKAAGSDKMFEIMLKDYEASIDTVRAALKEGKP